MNPDCIHWFRRDLRLDDNTALYHALSRFQAVQPIFIFDTNILDQLPDRCDRRVAFIHEQLTALHQALQQHGAALWVFHGDPKDILAELIKRHQPEAIYANRDYEPYARKRDQEVGKMLERNAVQFKTYKDHVIFEQQEVVKDNGEPYVVYTPYSKKWKQQLSANHLKSHSIKGLTNRFHSSDIDSLPTLSDIGFEAHVADWPAPQTDAARLSTYSQLRDLPAEDATTKVSVHLRFGTTSIRSLVKHAQQHSEKYLNELIWRDFYQQILWHFPRVRTESFRKPYDGIQWRNNEDEFNRWCEGKTGYPLVDAGMRQLNETGFMHNRVRMVVASFLCKHLLIDWRWGEAYFAQKLLDYDLASNNGGWQWAAGSGVDAAPYFRVFNPHLQLEKFDHELAYVRTWVQEFDTDRYPTYMVEHKMARQRALDTYQAALK